MLNDKKTLFFLLICSLFLFFHYPTYCNAGFKFLEGEKKIKNHIKDYSEDAWYVENKGELGEPANIVKKKALILARIHILDEMGISIDSTKIYSYFLNGELNDSLSAIYIDFFEQLNKVCVEKEYALFWKMDFHMENEDTVFLYKTIIENEVIENELTDKFIEKYYNKIANFKEEADKYVAEDNFIKAIKENIEINNICKNLFDIYGFGNEKSQEWVETMDNSLNYIKNILSDFHFNPIQKRISDIHENDKTIRKVEVILYLKADDQRVPIRKSEILIDYDKDNITILETERKCFTDNNGQVNITINHVVDPANNNLIVLRPFIPQLDSTLDAYLPKFTIELLKQGVIIGDENMVEIEAGEFIFGSDPNTDGLSQPDEYPQNRVWVDAFKIDMYEVTNAQYRKFIEETGYDNYPKYLYDERFNQDNYPVVGLTWEDAKNYADWAGKRLPTEAEWEKAARGTEGQIYPWPGEYHPNYAVSSENSNRTSPVGIYQLGRSIYQVYDMSGNVWEWCLDWYDENIYSNYNSSTKNPSGPGSGVKRVIRGGCWSSSKEDLRCANRMGLNPNIQTNTVGFRCVKDINE